MYINSPGGSVYDGLGIFDTMQHVKPDTIKEDTDRDFYMSPNEAVEYGLIDLVLDKKPIKV